MVDKRQTTSKLGFALQEVRLLSGLTSRQAAEVLGISHEDLRDIEMLKKTFSTEDWKHAFRLVLGAQQITTGAGNTNAVSKL